MRLLVLANSFKEGGRCPAGIELDSNNKVVLINNKPKWVRPICNTEHCQVPTHLVSHIKILDIIEISNIQDAANGYQSENVLFDESSIRVIGRFNKANLSDVCENNYRVIFGNRGKAVPGNSIENLSYSLMMINIDNFEIFERTYDDNPNAQIRLIFTYNNNRYDLPITDPDFLRDYARDPDLISNVGELILVLSLGVVWKDWYYKLVASIIY